MALTSVLKNKLSKFDRKSTRPLREAAIAYANDPGFLSALLALCLDPDEKISSGATWLLKANLEDGDELSGEECVFLFENLHKILAWDAQLHICQLLKFIEIPEASAENLSGWLQGLTDNKRPFLRAWSIDGLSQLAKQHPEYRGTADAALENGAQDEAASVRARVRNLLAG